MSDSLRLVGSFGFALLAAMGQAEAKNLGLDGGSLYLARLEP